MQIHRSRTNYVIFIYYFSHICKWNTLVKELNENVMQDRKKHTYTYSNVILYSETIDFPFFK